MNLINYSDSILSFLVPLVTIILAISTGRVVVSLLSGAVLGAFMLNGFDIQAISYLFAKLKNIFISDGSIDLWTLNIFLFLMLLGSMTALLTLNGATSAFAQWAHTKVKSRRGASLLTVALGIILFIDDYFNALGVGAVSRPVTDSFKISRAKLAYLIDSTSAPMVIMTPISSWGGYIIALLGTTFAAHQIEIGSLSAYVQMIPMNFYAILALILVVYTAYSNFNIAAMARHEERALQGHLYYEGAGAPESSINIREGKNGRVFELFLAVLILVFVTIVALVYTGYSAMGMQNHNFGLIEALEVSDVGLSLVYGSGSALLTALLFTIGKKLELLEIVKTVAKGAFTMRDALVVLTAAWLIGAVIKDIHTGQYIASIVEAHLNLALLPALIFTLSAIMAFATGTSWGTFGIMIAITVNIATASDPEQMLVLLSAVLSGAVMGDHCSPISDTTILSSIGARSNHIDHVKTQLPYALLSGSAALCGFLVLGMTGSLALAWLVSFILFIILIYGLRKLYPASKTASAI